jgi:CRISPR-associated protein Csx10
MNAITLTLELLEPMLCVGLEGDPNSGVSLKYIPGSVLRGAIIGKYGKITDASSPKERELFFDDSVRYLNAYPLIEGKRSLPVPLSWHKEKDAEEIKGCEFYDFIRADKALLSAPKSLSTNFFTFTSNALDCAAIYKAETKTRLAIHTQRDAKKGRSTSESGAVFRYESIVKGTKFSSAIISEKDSLLDEILTLNLIPKGTEIFVGGSRTSGYGKARIIEIKKDNDFSERLVGTCWQENTDTEFPYRFTVTLLSHAIVRDDNGQFQTDISKEFESLGELDEKNTYKKAEVIGGFNRKWGLPLPQITAVKAGSVFTFKAKKDIAATEFQTLTESGIGEKRLDGFGRIAINFSENEDAFSFDEVTQAKDKVALISIDLGKKILEHIVSQRMEEKLLDTIANYKVEGKKEYLKNSQISRLRLVVRDVLRDKDKNIEPIIGKEKAGKDEFEGGFFNDLKKTARDQFQSVKVSGGQNSGSLQHWVTESLKQKNLFGKNISITLGNDSNKAEADNKDDKLQLEYHLHLIDGVLAKAAKENKR